MNEKRTEQQRGVGGLLVGLVVIGLLVFAIGFLVLRPLSDAATERAAYHAQAISAQAAAQQAAERERTERERQAQETTRQNWARTLDVLSILALVVVPVCAGIIILGGLVFVAERRADRREQMQVLLFNAERERRLLAREQARLQHRATMMQLTTGRTLIVSAEGREVTA